MPNLIEFSMLQHNKSIKNHMEIIIINNNYNYNEELNDKYKKTLKA